MSAFPFGAIAPIGAVTDIVAQAPAIHASAPTSFGSMMLDGVTRVEDKVASADALAKAFALDDTIPVHQVTFALEQARLSMELMLQVRGRLVEGYQQLMNMQL